MKRSFIVEYKKSRSPSVESLINFYKDEKPKEQKVKKKKLENKVREYFNSWRLGQ